MDAFWETVAPPVAAGGTGGSGTRIVTEVLSTAGVFMGAHLNRAGDSLDLSDFDWRWAKPYLEAEHGGSAAPLEMMEQELQVSLRAHLGELDATAARWGWKHPHAYLLLPWLDSVIPHLRFIHVVRDGRRIARSRNQKQPLYYGPAVFGAQAELWGEQERALRFWSWANERAADYGEQHMAERYLRVRFEDVCERPREECAQLIAFTRGDAPSEELLGRAAALVKPPPALAGEPLPPEVEEAGRHGLTRFGYV
ncbi:MAG TPA: sulfotransferase [Solirubrobacteraceae bacterium]|nr:sulfotransferase [Solirubrobacteraceae bacterium]